MKVELTMAECMRMARHEADNPSEISVGILAVDDYRTQRDDDRAHGRAAGLAEAAKWLDAQGDKVWAEESYALRQAAHVYRHAAMGVRRLIDTPSDGIDRCR